jgi:hypothetical protein
MNHDERALRVANISFEVGTCALLPHQLSDYAIALELEADAPGGPMHTMLAQEQDVSNKLFQKHGERDLFDPNPKHYNTSSLC